MNKGRLVLIRISHIVLHSQHFGLTQLKHSSEEAAISVCACVSVCVCGCVCVCECVCGCVVSADCDTPNACALEKSHLEKIVCDYKQQEELRDHSSHTLLEPIFFIINTYYKFFGRDMLLN